MKINAVILSTIMLGIFSNTHASIDKIGEYVGVSYGKTSISTGIVPTTATLDQKDSGFKLIYGLQFNKMFALEFAYHDFGDASLTGETGDQFKLRNNKTFTFLQNKTILYSASAFSINGVMSRNITPSLSLLGKLGFSTWEIEVDHSGIDNAAGYDVSGVDFFQYGFALQYKIKNNLSIRGEYENHDFSEGDATTAVTIGLIAHF